MKIYKNGMQLIYSETWKKQTKKISVVLTDFLIELEQKM